MLTQFSSPKARLGLDQFDTTDDLLLQKGGHRTLVSRSSSFSATFLAIVPCQSGILSRSVCGVFSRLQDFGPLARLGSMEYAVAVVMSLTIEISSELEPILKAEAGKAGLDPTAYTHQLLPASLPTEKQRAPSIS